MGQLPTRSRRDHRAAADQVLSLLQEYRPNDRNHGCAEDTKIILGGIHPRGTLDRQSSNLTDAQYLSAIYADPNSFGSFNAAHGFFPVDGIGYHPYPQEIKLSPNDAQVDRGLVACVPCSTPSIRASSFG